MRGRLRSAAFCSATFSLAVGVSQLSCGERSASALRPSLIPDAPAVPSLPAFGASWVFHPSSGASPRARFPLEDGRVLAVGEGGERWVMGAEGTARVAPAAAPEPLIDIGRSEGQFAFVGASGQVYLAEEPLGPFRSLRAPPERFLSVASSEGRLAAVAREGALWHASDWGRRWERSDAQLGNVVQVALAEQGRGLAFSVPERWWKTEDGGRSWQAAELEPVAVRQLSRSPDGWLRVEGLTGSLRYEGGQWRALERREGEAVGLVQLGAAPDASRIQARTAVLDENDYFSLELRKGEEARWFALGGPLGSRLTEQAVVGLPSRACQDVTVAKRGAHVAVVCGSGSSGPTSVPLTLFRSDDGGKTYSRGGSPFRGAWSELQLAVSGEGQVLLSGACPPHLSAPGCSPRGVYRWSAGDKTLEPLGLPGLGAVEGLLFGRSGQIYVLAAREKDQRLVLYVSSDDGRSFRVRDLEVGVLGERRGAGRAPPLQLGLDPEGLLSIALRVGGRWQLVIVDSEGQLLARGAPPAAATAMAAAGLRTLALDAGSRSLWESVDGGNSWELHALPRPLCGALSAAGREGECKVPVACSAGGCVLGDSLSRIGWGAPVDGLLAGVPGRTSEVATEEKRRTPISCTLSGEAWQVVEGLSAAPGAAAAAVGKTQWFAAAVDYETGAVWALRADERERRWKRQELLGALSEPTHYALSVLDQVEGSAAVRYRIPLASRGEQEISGIEVAWDNRFEDVFGRARLPDRARPLAGDYHSHAPRVLQAEPSLLSVAGRGVFLRLHPSLGDRQTTFFVDGRSVERLPATAWPASGVQKRTEMVRVGERVLPLGIYDEGQWLGWAERATNAPEHWTFGALTLGHPDARSAGLVQSVAIAYTGAVPGFAVVQATPAGSWWRAYVVPLTEQGRPYGEAHSAPLQADLSDPPAPCDAASRTGSPRVVAPAFPGSPHPVVISDPVDAPRLLVTGRAVLHGTAERPCVATFEASSARSLMRQNASSFGATNARGQERWAALLPLGDLAHAWAFLETSEARGQRQVQARPMSCRLDPNAVLPVAEPGDAATY